MIRMIMLLIMQKNLHMMNLGMMKVKRHMIMGTRKLMTTGWMREEMMKVIEIIGVFNFMPIVLPLYPKTAEGYVDCFDAA